MTSISLSGASGSSFVRSVFTCWACVALANPKVKINTERMSFFMLCIASVLSLMCCDNRKVRLRQTANGRANCRFRGIFVKQFNSIARFKISHCTPLSLRSSIAKTRDVKLTFIKEMQHAEFPSCLRFSFTGNKLEKSRKPQLLCVRMSQPRLEQKPWQPLSKLGGCSFARFLNAVEKLMHQRPNPIHFFFQREMARVEKMKLCTGDISFVEFSTLHRKDPIVFAPSDQHGGLLFTEILLPIGIDIQIPFCVVEDFKL